MKKGVTFCLCLLLVLQLSAQNNARQQLIKFFNEAEHCYLIDDYRQLEKCLRQYADTIKIYQDNLGDSIDVYQAYFAKMCGAFYYGIAEEDSCDYYSEQMYRISMDIFNKRNNVTNVMVLHEELAQLYYKTKQYDKAVVQLDSVFSYYDNLYTEEERDSFYYRPLSQLAMCNARLGNFGLALRQIDEAINDYYKKRKDSNYYETLRKRGKILMLQADSLGSTHYDKAVDCYRQYVNERYASIDKEMSTMSDSQRNQYWLATHQFLYDCFRLGNRAPEMLYDLALFSKDFLVRKKTTRTKWEQVRKALGKKDCAIEFVQFFGKQDEKRLGCLVLRNNSKKPMFIDLFSTDSLLLLPLTGQYNIGDAISISSYNIKDSLYNNLRLSQLIWPSRLMDAIGNSDKVYFSPDGMLHQLAIEYMMPDETKNCYRLSSTRNLTSRGRTPKLDTAIICGGMEYGAPTAPSHHDNDVMAYRFLSSQPTNISDLPGSKKEVELIYYTYRHQQGDTLLTGKAATDEEFLRLLNRQSQIIHLSTHGYFGGDIGICTDIKPLLYDNSMSESGLLFVGSANTLSDKTFDETLSDGVLSAAEIARQDLSSVELIVLSACQTGLGRLTDDGVYGILRGLKQAGAQSMIVSLWSVNDYSSSLLMSFFYDELGKQTTKNIHNAFLAARQRLKKETKTVAKINPETLAIKEEQISFDRPYHVNPFIIIDAF